MKPLSRRQLLRTTLAAAGVVGLWTVAACAPAPAAAPAATQPAAAPPTPAGKPTQAAAPTTAAKPAAATQAPAAAGQPKTLRFVWLGDLTPLWHPSQYETFGQAVIFSLMFNNLVKIDEDLKTIIPDLAERWEVSPDATQFTFHLNKAARWHDGIPVTAADVVFSFTSQLLNPTIRPARMLALKGADDYKSGKADKVAGIEQLDDSTVRLTLREPDVTFLVVLREPEQVIVPQHVLKDVKPDTIKNHPFVLKSPVGSGPYKFVQYVTDQYVEFDVNPEYFKGKPKIDKIFMKRLNPDVTVAQLESGEVDLALRLNPVEFERLSKVPSLNVISRPGVGMTAMNFPVFVQAQHPDGSWGWERHTTIGSKIELTLEFVMHIDTLIGGLASRP